MEEWNRATNRPYSIGIARYFRGLHKLILLPQNDRDTTYFRTPGVLKDFYETAEKEFLEARKVFPECNIPKITIKGFPRE